jgi:hypothetical protein
MDKYKKGNSCQKIKMSPDERAHGNIIKTFQHSQRSLPIRREEH